MTNKIKILFVCHGNICRSPMAKFLFKDKIAKLGMSSQFEISSVATSNEEIGAPIHYRTNAILKSLGIDGSLKRARQITLKDLNYYDYIIAMDHYNMANLARMFGYNMKFRLLNDKDIADPWYTGDFNRTFLEIDLGLNNLLQELTSSIK